MIDALEKKHDFGRCSYTRLKSEARIYGITELHNIYTGKRIISIEKLKNKLDHLCYNILYSNIFPNLYSGKNNRMTRNR